MEGFYLADAQQQAYHELRDHIVVGNKKKGLGEVIGDVFAFHTVDCDDGDEATPIYEASQVWAGKLSGTGEAITAGQKVYATLTSVYQLCTASPVGVIGTDYYFVGIAKRDALAEDDQVLVRYKGDEYNHPDRG